MARSISDHYPIELDLPITETNEIPSSSISVSISWFFHLFHYIRVNQKICNILITWDNLVVLEASAEVMQMTNHIRPWNAELAWYSPRDTHRICPYGFEHGFGVHWVFLIVAVLAIQAKFLNPSGYNTVINYTFNFQTTNHETKATENIKLLIISIERSLNIKNKTMKKYQRKPYKQKQYNFERSTQSLNRSYSVVWIWKLTT